MRKLLLTSSALVAAASISSYAVADVSVTGGLSGHTSQYLQVSLQLMVTVWLLIMRLLSVFLIKLTMV